MGGSKVMGPVISVAVVFSLVLIPILLIPALYVFLNVYAMMKGTAFDAQTANVGVVFAGIAVITATFIVLISAGVYAIARGMGYTRGKEPAEED